MATSRKVGTETKDRLEKLQAEIKLETERKVTQQELPKRIVAREFDSTEALVDSFRDEWEGLIEEGTEQFGQVDDFDVVLVPAGLAEMNTRTFAVLSALGTLSFELLLVGLTLGVLTWL